MCGIAGFIDFSGDSSRKDLENMIETLKHRGPDDFGLEVFQEDKLIIGLAQSRLSIIDLSHGGHQPMHFKDLSIVFNGEIYNYQEIKDELVLMGHSFDSHSDTEVILHAVDEWGLKAVDKFIGMFAFVIYNRKLNQIIFTRDRAGVKPLYYYFKDGLFIFGSELKSLMAHPNFKKEIDISILPSFLNYGNIPSPHSIFKDTKKLLSGHHMVLDLNNTSITLERYWDVNAFYRAPKTELSYKEAKEKLHELLKSACQYRMIADVPVGVFLSGGYDSAAITAILQANSKEKLKTFTIGFKEGNDEAKYAKQTAEYLGTEHTEYYCSAKEAQDIIKEIPFYFDEPYGDDSAIPTILVSRVAKKNVTVALSADAGDELFFGYNSYFVQNKNLKKLRRTPLFVKLGAPIMAKLANLMPVSTELKYKAFSYFSSLSNNQIESAKRLFYFAKRKPDNYIRKFFKAEIDPRTDYLRDFDVSGFHMPQDVFMASDYKAYLQDVILTKVDRATMSTSLEGREPLLDQRILEFSATLPLEFKYNENDGGKRILKEIVHEYIPKEMMNRPKSGFTPPINKWLREDLSYLIEEYLCPQALKESNVFDVDFVSSQVTLFKENRLHYTPVIWNLLMFQMWWKMWMQKTENN